MKEEKNETIPVKDLALVLTLGDIVFNTATIRKLMAAIEVGDRNEAYKLATGMLIHNCKIIENNVDIDLLEKSIV